MINKKRRGISTFIATLLLMVLSVSAGVLIYEYTTSYIGGFGGPQTLGSISIDIWSLTTGVSGQATAYIRNIGKTSFQLNAVYINGEAKTGTLDPTTLTEGGISTLTINYAFQPSTTYDVKIIGVDNTQLTFQVKK